MDVIAVVRDMQAQKRHELEQLKFIEERLKALNLEAERHKAECAVLKQYAGMEE